MVEASATLPPLPAAVEVAAFRIVQETLTNMVRHAEACHCTVRLALGAGALVVEVQDDGRGIEREGGRQGHGGVGLASMRERAEELGGTPGIESLPGSGTRVRARLPLPTDPKGFKTLRVYSW